MAADKPRLTAKQKRFLEEYVIDRNATQAYFRAFGRTTSKGKRRSYNVASESARRLLEKSEIQAELEKAEAELQARCRVDASRVVNEYASIAFADVGEAFDPDPNGGPLIAKKLHDIPAPTRRAIQSVKVKRRRIAGNGQELYEVEEVEYKFAPKADALAKLAQHLGLFKDGAAALAGGRYTIVFEGNDDGG